MMLSIGLTKDLVYGAFALSLACALGTMIAVVWRLARARQGRWPWALVVPVILGALASWFWLYPSFAIGVLIGGDVGAALGRHLTPIADAAVMAGGIGLAVYLAFTAPIAALTYGLGLAVTRPRATPDRPAETVPVQQNGPWDIAIEHPVLARLADLPGEAVQSAVRFHANMLARARRYRLPKAG